MSSPTYAFGPFVLDTADRRLLRDGATVEVSGRYFDALALLAAESGRLVTKNRFMDEVWRGIPVTDEALTQCIRSLRRALEDDAVAPRYIETVPRHGYRFIAPVDIGAPAQASTRSEFRSTVVHLSLARDIAAGALGGGLAGVVAGLLYLSAGMVAPAMGAASTLLVLVSINLLLGTLAGGAVTLGLVAMEASGRAAWRPVLGASLGGLVIGAIGRMVGNDLFALLFGQAPGAITGAGEGLLVGFSVGVGQVLASRLAGRAWLQVAAGFFSGGAGGLVIAACGGRLMAGSLAALAGAFPNSRLGMGPMLGDRVFGPSGLALATTLESALFAGGVVLALTVARRVRPR